MVSTEDSTTASNITKVVDPMQLASRWRSPSDWAAVAAGMDSEPAPSHLSTTNSSGLFAVVSTDKLSVKYLGAQHHGHDVGAVQADQPAPKRCAVYFFEMEVKNAGLRGCTSIGFTQDSFKMRRQPGWEDNSIGYHGDDGYLYRGHGKSEPFGPTFTVGDKIGAGINYLSQEFFFTKNGNVVGAVPKDIKGPLYPTVAVHSENEEIAVNFGKEPFVFDVEAYVFEEKLKRQSVFEKLHVQPELSHWIVRSYLLHYGYLDTLTSFDIATDSNPSITHQNGFGEPPEMYGLSHRKVLRQLIMSGDIDSAFRKIKEWYPQVIQDETSVICFFLHSQRFIEYIRVGQQEEAVNYARRSFARFFAHKAFEDMAKESAALLAYPDPAESCVGYLLDPSQREFVADAVNAAVLSTNPNQKDPESCMFTCLEKLLRQLTVCSLERRTFHEDQGDTFFLHKEMQAPGKVRSS